MLLCCFTQGNSTGGADALLSSLFVALSQRNFVQGLRIKDLVQIWKKFA